ncbi:hypothetical protein [Actinokineospora sp. NPDC004072]
MSAPQRPGPPPPWPPQRPPHGNAGATEWIPRVQEPRRDEPFRFEEPPPPQRPANPAAVWAMRIAGLVAIAVISGVVWAYLQGDSPEPGPVTDPGPSTEAPAGRFEFAAHPDMPEPKVDTDCGENAYGQVQRFLREHPCVDLTRALYTSKPPGQDETVYTWVAVVELPSEDQAQQLYDLAKTDNTGNVNDPLRADFVSIEGLRSLGKGGYYSQRNKAHVIIVESDWAPSGDRTAQQDKFLTEVSADAVRLGLAFTKD